MYIGVFNYFKIEKEILILKKKHFSFKIYVRKLGNLIVCTKFVFVHLKQQKLLLYTF